MADQAEWRTSIDADRVMEVMDQLVDAAALEVTENEGHTVVATNKYLILSRAFGVLKMIADTTVGISTIQTITSMQMPGGEENRAVFNDYVTRGLKALLDSQIITTEVNDQIIGILMES
jgi:hypothetical protein